MKFRMGESDNNIWIDVDAEDVKDAALLTRLGLNKTKKVKMSIYAGKDGNFSAYIHFFKKKKETGFLK